MNIHIVDVYFTAASLVPLIPTIAVKIIRSIKRYCTHLQDR